MHGSSILSRDYRVLLFQTEQQRKASQSINQPPGIATCMDKKELEKKVQEHVEKRKSAYVKMGTVDSE
jgi:hypothetical protein